MEGHLLALLVPLGAAIYWQSRRLAGRIRRRRAALPAGRRRDLVLPRHRR